MAPKKKPPDPDWQHFVMTAALVAGGVIVLAVVVQTLFAHYQLLAPLNPSDQPEPSPEPDDGSYI